ncbi:hypothetical protein AFCDBAGC_2415 [Methylobacterium cerastii]|uniref:Uncharacterized protein n=1 Tax=Methylobacterium cerastii TaxID=932741 RepID=A0ABQ4QH69_9HYPH|nr:hypothetical protein FV229_13585 [Methylobacterium sp. WL120]TXM76038.1 hypothetical protein FV226_02470 [Methylobacterium sp. WL12]TXN06985.1 hypothetical protein FV222_03710 [Methylobacterium sp. WL103]TXN82310.1 hypothetical protein FV234_10545 [Methylobacterium sp. WL8]GJD44548.1 hypothetical protein AFCDBAGC_2415 [Methylobacterium cerastii]
MADAPPQRALYVITAHAQEGVLQQTRQMAASAVVLARRWIDAGHANVRIEDAKGELFTGDMFKAEFKDRHRGCF